MQIKSFPQLSRAMMDRNNLSAWEMCALERAVTTAIEQGELEKTSGNALLEKIQNTLTFKRIRGH